MFSLFSSLIYLLFKIYWMMRYITTICYTPTFLGEQMELTMGLFLYYVFSIILIVMLIRVVAKERVWSTLKFYFFSSRFICLQEFLRASETLVHLLYIWSHGVWIFFGSLIWGKPTGIPTDSMWFSDDPSLIFDVNSWVRHWGIWHTLF
jgi:hypothetical protein